MIEIALFIKFERAKKNPNTVNFYGLWLSKLATSSASTPARCKSVNDGPLTSHQPSMHEDCLLESEEWLVHVSVTHTSLSLPPHPTLPQIYYGGPPERILAS